MSEPEKKTCSRCNVEKPIDAFEVRADKGGARRGQCRPCRSEVREHGSARAHRPAVARTRSKHYAVRPTVLDCKGGCGTVLQQGRTGRLKEWCRPCRDVHYADKYSPAKPCLDCKVSGRFGVGQQRCEECRVRRQSAEEEARRLARESRVPATPSYTALHLQLREARGRAAGFPCTECGGPAHEWSYDHADPDEIVEIRRGRRVSYSLDHDRYRPMCRSCHNAFDARESDARRTCLAPGCESRFLDLRFGYCSAHELGPARGRGAGGGVSLKPELTALVLERVGAEATDVCIDCDEEKPVTEFSRNRRAPKGYVRVCRPCMSARSLARYYRKRGATA